MGGGTHTGIPTETVIRAEGENCEEHKIRAFGYMGYSISRKVRLNFSKPYL